jgi:hypothetical protein
VDHEQVVGTSVMGQFETKNNVRDDSSFLRSGRRARAMAALPIGISRSCCQRGEASLSPHLLAQGIVTRMRRGKDSGRSLEPGPQCGCALDAALNEK